MIQQVCMSLLWRPSAEALSLSLSLSLERPELWEASLRRPKRKKRARVRSTGKNTGVLSDSDGREKQKQCARAGLLSEIRTRQTRHAPASTGMRLWSPAQPTEIVLKKRSSV